MVKLKNSTRGGSRDGAGRKPFADPNRTVQIRLPVRNFAKFQSLGRNRFVQTAVEAASIRYVIRNALSDCAVALEPEIAACYVNNLELGVGIDADIIAEVQSLQAMHDKNAADALIAAVKEKAPSKKIEALRRSVANRPNYLNHLWKIVSCDAIHFELEPYFLRRSE